MSNWNTPEQIKQLILRLAEISSITGTPGEVEMPQRIADILSELQYFKQNPEHLTVYPLPNDPQSRSFVTAFVRGKQASSKTVVLLSHFDVVGVDDFGMHKDFAFQPEAYTK